MAKRFTDTEKWKKQFIKSLSTVHKLFFLYLLDDCDHAGIWHVEHDVAQLRIGEQFDLNEVKKILNNHIIEFDNGEKWFIPYFIEFQYGELNSNVNAHKSVIDKLKKYDLMKHLNNSSQGVKDKDKDMDKDKDNESFEKFWKLYNKSGDRKKCLTKWKYIKKSDHEIIFEHVKKYVNATPNKQYRKNPLTYLNGECWNDEIVQDTKQQEKKSSTPTLKGDQYIYD